MQIKKQFKKLIPVVLIAIGNFYQDKEQVIQVDPEKFNIVDSEDKLIDFYDKYVYGLRLAKQFNRVLEYDMEFPIIKDNRTLRIEEAWYYIDRLFIAYSLDLKQSDGSPADIPSLYVENVTLDTLSGQPQNYTVNKTEYSHRLFKALEKGVVFNNRIYKGTFIRPDINSQSEYQEFINGVELKKIVLNDPTMKKNDENIQLEDITLNDIKYNFVEDEALTTISIDQDTRLTNGDIIHWDNLKIGLLHSKLNFNMEPVDAKIRSLNLDIEIPDKKNHMEDYLKLNQGEFFINNVGDKTSISIPSISCLPEFITLRLREAEYVGDESIKFNIPKKDLNAYFESLDTMEGGESYTPTENEVGKTMDYLFTYNGLIGEKERLNLQIGVKPRNDNAQVYSVLFMLNDVYEAQIEDSKEHGGNPFFDFRGYLRDPVIKITDDKGQEVEYDRRYAIPNSKGQTQNILIKNLTMIKNAQNLNVEIFNIPERVEIEHNEKIKIELNKS